MAKQKKVLESLSKVDGKAYKIRLNFDDLAEALHKDLDGSYYFDFWVEKLEKPTKKNLLKLLIESERETVGHLDPFFQIFHDLLEPEEFKKLLKKYGKSY